MISGIPSYWALEPECGILMIMFMLPFSSSKDSSPETSKPGLDGVHFATPGEEDLVDEAGARLRALAVHFLAGSWMVPPLLTLLSHIPWILGDLEVHGYL